MEFIENSWESTEEAILKSFKKADFSQNGTWNEDFSQATQVGLLKDAKTENCTFH